MKTCDWCGEEAVMWRYIQVKEDETLLVCGCCDDEADEMEENE